MKDLGKAFTFLFKDPQWVSKTAIAALWMILCVFLVGFFVLAGYFVQVTQRVMRREENPLPSWDGIGVKLVLGLKYAVVYLIYLLPVFILLFPVIGLAIATEVSGNEDAIGVAATVYLFGFTLFIIPYSLALTLFTPIITYRFAERERIGDAIDIVRVVGLFKRNWQNSLVVALIVAAIQSFAGIGIFLFLIGVFFTIFYAYLTGSYLSGLLYLESQPPKEAAA